MYYWTIRKQIIFGLSILILINIAVGIFTSMGISKLKSFAETISTGQLRGVYVMSQLQSNENEAYDLMLQHILAETKDDTESNNARLTDLGNKTDKLIAEYQQSPALADREKAMLEKVLADRAAFQATWAPRA